MLNKLNVLAASFGLLGSFALAAPATAEEQNVSAVSEQAVVVRVPSPLGLKMLDSRALAKHRGGSDAQVINDMKLSGVVSDNRASNLTTGNNVITDGAFAGVNGVPLVVQNSGNNVLIQSATIVNVQVK